MRGAIVARRGSPSSGPRRRLPASTPWRCLPGWEKSRGANGELALAEVARPPEVLDARTFKPYDFATKPIREERRVQERAYTVKDSAATRTSVPDRRCPRCRRPAKGTSTASRSSPSSAVAKLYEAGAKQVRQGQLEEGHSPVPLRRLGLLPAPGFKLSEGWTDEDHAAALIAWNAVGFGPSTTSSWAFFPPS
jgi:hypothetical protein